MPTRSHSLSLVSPPSTINARQYFYFVHVCFVWNQVPIDILGIESCHSFRHAAYKHLLYFLSVIFVIVIIFCIVLFLCNIVFELYFRQYLEQARLLYCSFPCGKLIIIIIIMLRVVPSSMPITLLYSFRII